MDYEAAAIARALNVSVGWLCGETEKKLLAKRYSLCGLRNRQSPRRVNGSFLE